MARILAYTTPGRGHLFPLVPILEELRRRGHRVALRTLAAEVAAMRQRGFDAAPVDDRIEAMFCPYPLPLRSADAPPFGPGLPPAGGPLGRLRDQLLRPVVFGTLERTMVPPLNRVRAELGLTPVAGADDIFGRAPLLLYLTAEPFEYPRRDWPGNVVMVGPCHWDPPADPPGWLERLDRPVVLVTTSSEFQDDARLVKATLEALAGEPVAVVATLPASDPAAVPVPANARMERFVPHGLVLDRAMCAVPHEGASAPTACAPRSTRRSGCARAPSASSRPFAAAAGPSAAADAFGIRLLNMELPQKLPSRQDQASSARP
jgi:UDP:flavonoid glycosyltransferase YjiC (YdhE family)